MKIFIKHRFDKHDNRIFAHFDDIYLYFSWREKIYRYCTYQDEDIRDDFGLQGARIFVDYSNNYVWYYDKS